MVISSRKLFVFLSLVALITFPNHTIINYSFSGSFLSIWKQLICSILIFLLFLIFHKKKLTFRKGFSDVIFLCLLLYFFLFYSIFSGSGLLRSIYAIFFYIGCVSFIYLPHFSQNINRILKIIFYTSFISCIGIVIDYLFPIFNFLKDVDLEFQIETDSFVRASFFYGASTLAIQHILFGLFAGYLLLNHNKTAKLYFIFLLFIIISIVAIMLTGSRAAIGIYIIGLLIIIFKIFSGSINLKLIPIFLILFSFIFYQNIVEFFEFFMPRIQSAFSLIDSGNSHRLSRWEEALALFTKDFPNNIFGHGIGTTLGNLDSSAKYSTHYESSFFQAFYEGGYIGLLTRYYVFIMSIAYAVLRPIKSNLINLMIAYQVLFFLSTAVAPTIGAFHNQMLYFLSYGIIKFGVKI